MIDKTSLLTSALGASNPMARTQSAKVSADKGSFSDVLVGMLNQTSKAQQAASDAFKAVQMGSPTASIEEAAISQATAGVQFQMVVQTRNKLVQAYTDIMNMPV